MRPLCGFLALLLGCATPGIAQDAPPDPAHMTEAAMADGDLPDAPDTAYEAETESNAPDPDHPEARLYDASINAQNAIERAMGKAAESGKLVMIVFGANWCHDSRAFAGWTEQARFKELIDAHYQLVFVNVGMPQTGDGHNLDVPKRFNIEIKGTPTVLILGSDGALLNADSATSWRNAASRSEDEVFDELASFTDS